MSFTCSVCSHIHHINPGTFEGSKADFETHIVTDMLRPHPWFFYLNDMSGFADGSWLLEFIRRSEKAAGSVSVIYSAPSTPSRRYAAEINPPSNNPQSSNAGEFITAPTLSRLCLKLRCDLCLTLF